MFVYQVIRDLESIYHLCINPIHRIGLIHKWYLDSRRLKWSVPVNVLLNNCNKILRHCHFWLARLYPMYTIHFQLVSGKIALTKHCSSLSRELQARMIGVTDNFKFQTAYPVPGLTITSYLRYPIRHRIRHSINNCIWSNHCYTVLPAKSDSDVMFCLPCY